MAQVSMSNYLQLDNTRMLARIGVLLGFVAALAIARTEACGGELTGQSGTFTSPNYPNEYSNDAKCEWTLNTGNVDFTLAFSDGFDIENQAACNYDYLEVNMDSGSPLKFCGTAVPEPITLHGNVTITFKSDGTVKKIGFSASYSVGAPVPVPTACGGTFEETDGVVQSPNYPSNYDNNLDCTYTITIPEGQVKLKFEDFDVEASTSGCTYDYLEVLENGVSKKKLCGTSASTYKASSNSVQLKFKTDSSVQQKGWEIKYERAMCNYPCVQASACNGTPLNEYCAIEGEVCCEPDISVRGCGQRPESRIVGGNQAERHEWPWQASLQTTSSSFHFCGATLINNWWVLTAAHCVDGDTISGLKVILGEHHVTGDLEDSPIVSKSVSKIIMHEDYDGNGNGFPNDIALVKFDSPVTFTDQIIPACLPPANMVIAGNDNCWISGWGKTQGTGESEILNELKANILINEECERRWGSSYINNGHVCLNNGLTGACNGDSGGPLSCKGDDDKWYVNGATSWGRSGCQTEGYPSVYSRVTFFRSWIVEKLENN